MRLSKKKLLLIISVIILIAGMIFILLPIDNNNIFEIQNKTINKRIVRDSSEFIHIAMNDVYFYNAVKDYPLIKDNCKVYPQGLVVPHHNLAGDLIAEAMSKVSCRDVKKIFLIGPNHEDQGEPIISYPAGFEINAEKIDIDKQTLLKIRENNYIDYDYNQYYREHSLKVLIPYINYYFPEAEIVPMIFTSRFNDLETLSQSIAKESDENSLLIASIDFSHYLSFDEAESKDAETERAINDWNYKFFDEFNSDYLDSPICLKILMRTMEILDNREVNIINHSNSYIISGNDPDFTTSYFTISYSK